MRRRSRFFYLAFALFLLPATLRSQISSPAAPGPARVGPPRADASPAALEAEGDELRAAKAYLVALDYYNAALKKSPTAELYNKAGIAELQLTELGRAKKYFEDAIHSEHDYSEAHNNLGVLFYMQKKYGKAVKEYRKALKLNDDSASFHVNLATAYFSLGSKHKGEKPSPDMLKALAEYRRALELDPQILQAHSTLGIAAQMSSPDDRANYAFQVARLYAELGNLDLSLHYLRKAMEEGYKGISSVYKDQEFAAVRKDPRFAQLMASRPMAIPQ